MTILAIETSCDETSVAILKNKKVLSNVIASQIDLHQKYGGVVPEVAARAHSDNIFSVLKKSIAIAKIDIKTIDYVAYTATPGFISCLNVGKVIAQTIATYVNKPLIPCNHLSSHIYASIIDNNWDFPVLGLLVSGGHTQLILLKEHLKFEVIGETLDDAVGECYDKVARMMGLNYPGGPEIERLAKEGKFIYKLPLPKNDQTLDFSFSGLKSACAKAISSEDLKLNIKDFSFSLQETITKILLIKLQSAINIYNPRTIVLAGGVSANQYLRDKFMRLKDKYKSLNFIVPDFKYCTDNAAMVGILAHYHIITKSEI